MAPLPREGAPDSLELSFGGFFAESHRWELRGDTVVYRRSPPDQSDTTTVRRVTTAEDWRDFWAAAARAGVDEWRDAYVNEDIVDGVGWTLLLVAEDLRVESHGSNAFPDREGRQRGPGTTDAFEELRSAVEELAGTGS